MDIPIVRLTASPDQSGGKVKRKPGRPKGSRDKAPRRRRARKSTPYPRSRGPSEALAAARRRLREAERLERDVFEVGPRGTSADARLRRELQQGRISPAEAREVRRDAEREAAEDARVERLLQRQREEAAETRRVAQREGERTRESARALGKQTRKAIAASPIRTRASRLAAGAPHPSPLHSPGGGALSSLVSGVGTAASTLAGLVTPAPATPPPLAGASGFTPSGAPSPLPRAPPPKRKGDGVPKPAKAQKKPCECHYKSHAGDHVKHVCKATMDHAEKHGKKACRDHMRELKDMADRIKETRAYIRSMAN